MLRAARTDHRLRRAGPRAAGDQRRERLDNVTIECLPGALHNRPKEIPELVRAASAAPAPPKCGRGPRSADRSGGRRRLVDASATRRRRRTSVDRLALRRDPRRVRRLRHRRTPRPGVRGGGRRDARRRPLLPVLRDRRRFDRLQDHELGSFYLTDFLVRHFDRLIWQGLGIDDHPELLPMYFGNYTRLVYLAQADDSGARRLRRGGRRPARARPARRAHRLRRAGVDRRRVHPAPRRRTRTTLD